MTTNLSPPLLVGRNPIDMIVLGKSINLHFLLRLIKPFPQILHPSLITNFSIAVAPKADDLISTMFGGKEILRKDLHHVKALPFIEVSPVK